MWNSCLEFVVCTRFDTILERNCCLYVTLEGEECVSWALFMSKQIRIQMKQEPVILFNLLFRHKSDIEMYQLISVIYLGVGWGGRPWLDHLGERKKDI